MEKLWFILSEGEVSGPYTTEDVDRSLQSGRWNRETLIWWKGHRDWTKISAWQVDLPNILTTLANLNMEPQWYLYYDGKQTGPLGRTTLISTMRTITQLKNARVWNSTLTDWKSVFDVPELLMDLGVLTRQYPRAPIAGEVEVQSSTGRQLRYTLCTISEGGFGVVSAPELRMGERVHFMIRSPMLVAPLRAIARVVSQHETVGFSFEALTSDAHSIILEYVRQQATQLAVDLEHANASAADRASFQGEPEEDTNDRIKAAAVHPTAAKPASWFINRMGVEQGPMSKDELIAILSGIDDKSMVRVSNDNHEWKGPFDFDEVISALGINRRQYQRAPIIGELMLQHLDRRFFFEVISISERGAGLRGDMPYQPGALLRGVLDCPILKTKIEVEVECIHSPNYRVTAVKFASIEKVHRVEIRNYVSMFGKPASAHPRGREAA